jgi:hypothetical protein
MIASGTPPPELEGDGWLAQSDTRGALSEIRVVRRGPSLRPALRAFYVTECSARPEQLPPEIPFVSELSCLVTLSETSGHASWPASQAHEPDVSSFLEALLPPFYIHSNHPRRLLPVLKKLRARLLQMFPGDPRGDELYRVADRMKEVVRGVGSAIPDDERASPADMAALWQVYDTLGMPWQTVVRLENGFDELHRWLAVAGWTEEKTPGPLWMGPVPGRSRLAFFRRREAAAQLLRGTRATGYGSLGMDWQADAYV